MSSISLQLLSYTSSGLTNHPYPSFGKGGERCAMCKTHLYRHLFTAPQPVYYMTGGINRHAVAAPTQHVKASSCGSPPFPKEGLGWFAVSVNIKITQRARSFCLMCQDIKAPCPLCCKKTIVTSAAAGILHDKEALTDMRRQPLHNMYRRHHAAPLLSQRRGWGGLLSP